MGLFRLLLTCLVSGVLVCSVAAAQSPPAPEATPTVTPTPPAPTVLESIDHGFKRAVDVMNAVLFYRLFTTERQYVVYERSEQYVRARDLWPIVTRRLSALIRGGLWMLPRN